MSVKSILLINPPFFINDEFKDNHFTVWPHLGILTIAQILRKNKYKVYVEDFTSKTYDCDLLLSTIKDMKIDYIGITSTSPQAKNAYIIANNIKTVFNTMKIFMGGPHATFKWQEVMNAVNIDAIILGEGEDATLKLLQALDENTPELIKEIDGIVYKVNDDVVINEKKYYIHNMDEVELPAYDLIDIEQHMDYMYQKEGFRSIPYITSRGCPFNCIFCAVHGMMGKKLRSRSAEKVVEDIKEIMETYKAEGIWFKDSTFTADRRWVNEFCDIIIRENFKFKWNCNTRIDCIDKEMLEKMKLAGLKGIWFGIESGSEKISKILNKNLVVKNVKEMVCLCKELDIETSSWMIIGSPTEELSDIKQSVRLIKELNLDSVHWHALVPLPGSKVYDDLLESGHLFTDYEKLSFNQAVVDTGYLTAAQIQSLLNQIIQQGNKGCYNEELLFVD